MRTRKDEPSVRFRLVGKHLYRAQQLRNALDFVEYDRAGMLPEKLGWIR